MFLRLQLGFDMISTVLILEYFDRHLNEEVDIYSPF